jgi:ANTAR domain
VTHVSRNVTPVQDKSQICVPAAQPQPSRGPDGTDGLTAGPPAAGFLSLISRTAGAFDDQAQDLAAVFAQHAAIALAGKESLRQLQEALRSRDAIGQAKGIMMERHGILPDHAFAILTRVSQAIDVKLRDAAEELCRTGARPAASSTWQLALGQVPAAAAQRR